MPITEILEKNAKEYGKDVCLVEINPDLQEKKRVTIPSAVLTASGSQKEKSNMERLRINRIQSNVSV